MRAAQERIRRQAQRELNAALRAAVEERDRYIATHGLEPAVWLGAANWAPEAANDYLESYLVLRDGAEGALARLRELGRSFSGYDIAKIETDPDHKSWVEMWRLYAGRIPRRYWVNPPPVAGERGDVVDGVIVNHDTAVYQERVNLLYESGVLRWLRWRWRPRILEVGGGYGALALALTGALPRARYTICDLPESLMFSGNYLAACGRDTAVGVDAARISLLPNYRFRELAGRQFNLVINTLSMSEMTEIQVAAYSDGIAKLIGKFGLFFEQNQDNRHLGFLYARETIKEHFPHSLELVLNGAPMTQGKATIWANRDLAFLAAYQRRMKPAAAAETRRLGT